MRLLGVFQKCLREQVRDPLMLVLSLIFAPAFVFLYWLFFPEGSTTYGVLVLNEDAGAVMTDGRLYQAGEEVMAALRQVTYRDGKPLLTVDAITDRRAAENRLRDRDAEVLLIIPRGFSTALQAARDQRRAPTDPVVFIGDLTNPYYAVAAVMTSAALDGVIQTATGLPRPVQVVEEPLGASAARTEFENYVPGLLVFAVIMLVFLAAMAVTREVESGTLRRLRTTQMTTLDFLGGIGAAIALIGMISVILTFLTALALGFRSQGPLGAAILIGAVTSLSIVGVGLIVACFSRTVTQAFLIANFPLALFMFFSGAIFPIPRVALFTAGGRPVGLYDILPPTHAVVALNKILTLGADLGDVLYELTALLVLSAVYFAFGVWLFQRRRMQAG